MFFRDVLDNEYQLTSQNDSIRRFVAIANHAALHKNLNEVFMALTIQQKLAIGSGVTGAATVAFGSLNSIMTPTTALIGTVCLGFVTACLSVISTVVSSTSAQIKTVMGNEGVDRLLVNAKATDGVAAAAIDPAQPKVAASTPEIRATLLEKAPA